MIEPLLSDEAFLADVKSAADHRTLYAWWLGQSGFLLQHEHCRILIDPYLSDSLTEKYAKTDKPHVRMSRRVVDPFMLRQISIIIVSHGHTDHLDPVTLREIRRGDQQEQTPWDPIFVAPRAIKKLVEERWGSGADVLLNDDESNAWGDVRIDAIASAHEMIDRNERGWCPYLGYLVHLGPFTIYHSGDTVLYEGLASRLRPFHVDLALLPINGRAPERQVAGNLWGREAAWLAKEIGAKLVIPCHYDMFEFNTAAPGEFIAECERLGQAYTVLRLGERLALRSEKA